MYIHKQIYKEIKNAPKIIIARHIGPDPDALASSIGLKEIILNTFPNKEVYVVGSPTSKFKFLGQLDKFTEDMYSGLLIVTDTPDYKRIDGVDSKKFQKSIKIDHHPFIEKTCKLEWIDDTASSASQMIAELALNTKLKLTTETAEKLYAGIVADTNRFMFSYTSTKTFDIVSELLKNTNLNITKVYDNLYMRPYKEIKFQGYLSENFIITENGVGYVVIESDKLNEYGVDAATAGNMVNNFNHINEMLIWVTFTYDSDLKTYRTSIRSRGPIINNIASNFGGGGHIYASGARVKDKEEMQALIEALDQEAYNYNEKNEND